MEKKMTWCMKSRVTVKMRKRLTKKDKSKWSIICSNTLNSSLRLISQLSEDNKCSRDSKLLKRKCRRQIDQEALLQTLMIWQASIIQIFCKIRKLISTEIWALTKMMVWELDIVIKQPEKTYCNKFNYQGQMTKKVPETWKKQQTRSAPARGGLEGGQATSDS